MTEHKKKKNSAAKAAQIKKHAPRHAKKPKDWDDERLWDDIPAKPKKKPAAHSRSAKRAKARRRARAQKTAWGTLAAVCICVCALIVAFCAMSVTRYSEFLEMRAYLDMDTFYPGVTVDGVELSGYTLPDALDLFREREMDLASGQELTFNAGDSSFTKSAVELGFGSNYSAILKAAWEHGREGNIEKRYAEATQGKAYTVDRGFDEGVLRRATDAIAQDLSKEGKDAEILDFIFNRGEFVFSEEENGAYVDGEKLFAQAKQALEEGRGSVDVDVEVIEPDVTAQELSQMYGEMAVAVTNASSSNDNRISNIRLACASINCMILEPGQEFSFNETVGQRTKAAGYKKAGVYVSGELGEEIGGGICQVSTTLFNAVVKADLEVTERHNHSLPVSYVDNGKDATVSWGAQDFKFVNSSDEPIYLVAFVTDDWRVRVHIFGRLREDGLTVSLVPVLQETVKPRDEEEYRYTDEIPTGTTRVKSKARKGYRVNSYKAYTDADGNVVEKVFLCSSYYPPRAAIIEVGR